MPFKSGQSGNPKRRAQGSQNKITRALKESILQALDEAGGNEGAVGYLRWLAHENPSAFAGLLSKVLPSTIASTGQDGALKIILEQRIIRPQDRNSGAARRSVARRRNARSHLHGRAGMDASIVGNPQ